MPEFSPPTADMLFTLRHVIGLENVQNLPGQDALDFDLLEAVLTESGKLAGEVLAPINDTGDRAGAQWDDGVVTTAPGWKEAYAAYRDGGWNAVPFDPAWGGQGLPWCVAFPVQEMWQAANMAFGLCPLLNQGAVEAIAHHGSDEQKSYYLPKLVSGEWTGTMNLTEAQAGSDLAAVRSKAERNDGGTYKIFGQKIYITYGEHDMADNIIHLVLARLPDAPDGVKGISLFIVPKFLEDGTRNDVKCVSIEHKLGIHASPTCTMQFGDGGGAVGYLVGDEHAGIKYMFTMMNNARLSVGLQGVAICERATQAAIAYANDRVQGGKAIAEYGDVKRMIMTMRAITQAGRMMAYRAAYALDSGDQAYVDLMTPIVKSWCTDRSIDVASLGVQIHGGMGFIEETGAAQFYRDARILPIYEGTNGIQAADFLFRKVLRDEEKGLNHFIDTAQETIDASGDALKDRLQMSLVDLTMATRNVALLAKEKRFDDLSFVSSPYLGIMGYLSAALALTHAANEAKKCLEAGDYSILSEGALQDKVILAEFFAHHILPRTGALAHSVLHG